MPSEAASDYTNITWYSQLYVKTTSFDDAGWSCTFNLYWHFSLISVEIITVEPSISSTNSYYTFGTLSANSIFCISAGVLQQMEGVVTALRLSAGSAMKLNIAEAAQLGQAIAHFVAALQTTRVSVCVSVDSNLMCL